MSRLAEIRNMMTKRYRAFMARPRFTDAPYLVPGAFFDTNSYVAGIRTLVFAAVTIYGGQHFDSWGQWLWAQFGRELWVTPGKAQWHARVALVFGSIGLIVAPLQFVHIAKRRRRENALSPSLTVEIAERLAEKRQARREAGLPVEEPGPPTAEDQFCDALRRWPILHDLVWGWPLLLALPLMALADHVSALTGIFLGAIAYVISHNGLAKRRGHLGRRLVLATLVGTATVAVWFAYAPAITGGPVPDARIIAPLPSEHSG